jgi:hypothetical protein
MRKRSSRGPSDPPGNYEVGYRKPPQHTRFKPGQSGNPRGRPKAETSLGAALNDALNAKVKIRRNGKERVVSNIEAFALRVVTDAIQGNASAQKMLCGADGALRTDSRRRGYYRVRRERARQGNRRDRAHKETPAGKAAG